MKNCRIAANSRQNMRTREAVFDIRRQAPECFNAEDAVIMQFLPNRRPKPAISRILSLSPDLAKMSNHLSSPSITLGVKRSTWPEFSHAFRKFRLTLHPGKDLAVSLPNLQWGFALLRSLLR